MFGTASATYLHRVSSDHSPLITCLIEDHNKVWPSFKYDQRLIGKKGFKEEIASKRREARKGQRSTVMDLIKDCRKSISQWRRRNIPNSAIRIRELHHLIDMVTRSSPLNLEELHRLKSELNREYKNEEAYWRLKSRVL